MKKLLFMRKRSMNRFLISAFIMCMTTSVLKSEPVSSSVWEKVKIYASSWLHLPPVQGKRNQVPSYEKVFRSLIQDFKKHNQGIKYSLVTTLYNEKRPERMVEFILCLEKNLANASIDDIHILYDITQDDGRCLQLLEYLKVKPVHIHYIVGRPSYGACFEFAAQACNKKQVIIANADIFFNKTLALLEGIDLADKFIGLTRWNVQADGSIVEYTDTGSQDAWVVKVPFVPIGKNIKMGTTACDNCIAYEAYEAGLTLLNPSGSIQACHVHASQVFTPGHDDVVPGGRAVILRTQFNDRSVPFQERIRDSVCYNFLPNKVFFAHIRAYEMSLLYDGSNFEIDEVILAERTIAVLLATSPAFLKVLEEQELLSPVQAPYYALWQGLALSFMQRYEEAARKFTQAYEKGLAHWRVTWYRQCALNHDTSGVGYYSLSTLSR